MKVKAPAFDVLTTAMEAVRAFAAVKAHETQFSAYDVIRVDPSPMPNDMFGMGIMFSFGQRDLSVRQAHLYLDITLNFKLQLFKHPNSVSERQEIAKASGRFLNSEHEYFRPVVIVLTKVIFDWLVTGEEPNFEGIHQRYPVLLQILS